MAPVSATVTFLLTDIENSIRLGEEHPDAMRNALARHDATTPTTPPAVRLTRR